MPLRADTIAGIVAAIHPWFVQESLRGKREAFFLQAIPDESAARCGIRIYDERDVVAVLRALRMRSSQLRVRAPPAPDRPSGMPRANVYVERSTLEKLAELVAKEAEMRVRGAPEGIIITEAAKQLHIREPNTVRALLRVLEEEERIESREIDGATYWE